MTHLLLFWAGFFPGFLKVGLPKKTWWVFWVHAWVSEPCREVKLLVIADCHCFYTSTWNGSMWQTGLGHHSPPDCCVTVSDIAGRQWLHSAQCHQLDVPRYQHNTLSHRACSLSLQQPSGIRFQTSSDRRPRTLSDSRWRQYLLHSISVPSALEVVRQLRYMYRRFILLYLL